MTAAPAVGGPAGWLAWLTDDELESELGVDTVERGAAYHRSRAVSSLTVGRDGRVLLASVRGSRGRSYQTVVTARDVGAGEADGDLFGDEDGELAWAGQCSCPMRFDCKHVVAVILAARSRLAGGGRPATPAWEALLADVGRTRPAADGVVPLALHVEVVTPRPSRYAVTPSAPTLRLRPMTKGKNGGWIRTGVSWRDLDYGYRAARVGPRQQEALLALVATARARARGGYYALEQQLAAHDVGAALWRLLRESEEAGIPLVSGAKGETPVLLHEEPAAVVLDVRRTGPRGDATVTPRVRMPGAEAGVDREPDGSDGADQEPRLGGLVGTPPHGAFVQTADALVLARFDPPLDESIGTLVTRADVVTVPGAELPRFFSRYYPMLRQLADVESSDGSVTFPEVRPPRLALAVRFEPGHQTTLRWSFAYAVGEQTVTVPILGPAAAAASPAPADSVARDLPAEAALLAGLEVLDAMPGLRVVVGHERRLVPELRLRGLDTATFVSDVLPALTERDDVDVTVEGTPLPYAETEEAPLITVSATDSTAAGQAGAEDWFDLGITVTIAGEDVPFTPLFAALARGDEHLILDSGTWFSLDRPELHSLRRLIEEARSLQDRQSGTLRVTRWHAGLWEELVSLGVVAHQSERWSRAVGALLDLESIPAPPTPAGLRAELRDYQVQGYHWLALLWDHQLGGVLADDMGLGKTLQTLAMAARAHDLGTLTPEAPLLVVAPTSVVSTWQREAARFCPHLHVATVTETARRRGTSLPETVAGAHLVVTSYALLRLEEEAYRGLPWSGLVLDEAQFVKNHQAKTYQAARRLPAPFKLAITGTPLENSLMDLWALLSIVAPGLFPSPQRFTDLYRRPIESGEAPELLATLRRRIRPLMLRRTKEQVARDLPPKIEQVLNVRLNAQHQRVYQTHLQRERQRVLGMLDDVDRNRIAILRSLTVLRQLSLDVSLVDDELAGTVASSKIDALVEQLHELAAEGHRALVFSQFTGFLRLVRERLDAEGIGHVYLDGRTRDRPRRIATFREGDAPVFLISLKAGGSGLTLTEADYVFVLDPWWNPATEAQAVDRTHRIGQDKTVMVYRLVAQDTIEEKVIELQQRKRDLFTRVVDADGLMGAPMSADDIRGLLGA
ncbi:MAG TPA: DEAD/DEAH box helicase [Intrasporangium sp.]|uniref:DEAD/DEAH box helicase n=1 Tax=Intrasporangium sp. TaxID=1925024 RepID=UPI002D794ED9|nr:DEAD/DEAH box helicase [Intrasporangium sp.]HET7399145.1 DEAD/DEAH box helicase [Intrasporangium sp.]